MSKIMKDELCVEKSNELVEASINLSLIEARILDIIFSQITALPLCEKEACIALDDMNDFKVHVSKYVSIYGKNKDDIEENHYQNLKLACERLFSRYFTYFVQSEIYKDTVEVHKTRWVYDIGYSEKDAYITVALNPLVIKMIGNLKECFTKYDLTNKVGLTSQYAYRLYDICKQWVNKKYPTDISLYELRRKFGLENDQYTTMSNFKRVVLEPAIKQINENPASDITITYSQKKTGKVITHFTFIVKPKKTPKKAIDSKCKDITPKAESESQAEHGLTDKEQAIVKATADRYINEKGISDSKHKDNIYKRAIFEGWGLGEHDKQVADFDIQNKKVAEKISLDRQQANQERERLEQERQAGQQFIAYFESLDPAEQERITDIVQSEMTSVLLTMFKKSRANGKVYADPAFRSQFKKVMGISQS